MSRPEGWSLRGNSLRGSDASTSENATVRKDSRLQHLEVFLIMTLRITTVRIHGLYFDTQYSMFKSDTQHTGYDGDTQDNDYQHKGLNSNTHH